MRKYLTLRYKMAALSFVSVALAVTIGGIFISLKISNMLEKEMGNRALAIARTLSQMEMIQNQVGKEGGEKAIQPIAEKIRLATGVDYIVIVDMRKVRYSHPIAERIGKTFLDSDIDAALQGKEYISYTKGILGPSLRAFAPVKINEGTLQVGVVAVGMLTPTTSELLKAIQAHIYPSLAIGLIVGMLGSLFLANKLKGAMFGMEPEEIGKLLEERNAAFQALGEGIIFMDKNENITLVNREATRLMGIESSDEREYVHQSIKRNLLSAVLKSGEPELNREIVIKGTIVVCNCVPVKVREAVVGVVAVLRDKTEMNRLAEELTGVKNFVDALRVQKHEYMNKLHTIAGLIQLCKPDEALDFIFKVTEEQEEITNFLTSNIRDYSIAGLILGKYSRAKELQISMTIDRDSRLASLPQHVDPYDMVVIIGNLLENAIDAIKDFNPNQRKVYFGIFDLKNDITIIIRDCGPGIPAELRERVFERGVSTKAEKGRGFGLFLVKERLDKMGGSILIDSKQGKGTEVKINIPRLPGKDFKSVKSGGEGIDESN